MGCSDGFHFRTKHILPSLATVTLEVKDATSGFYFFFVFN